jgi:hypothetical protein
MKKLLLTISFVNVLIISFVNAEIKDPRVWTNFYKGCNEEYDSSSGLTKKEHAKYCSCSADGVVKKMEIRELLLLETNMLQEKTEEDQTRIILANNKLKNILVDCLSKIYQ